MIERSRIKTAHPSHASTTIDATDLIGQDQARLALKAGSNAKGCFVTAGRQGRNDNRPKHAMKFSRGNDNARSCFLDFTTNCGIEFSQPDFAALYHSRRASSALPNPRQAASSSPSGAAATSAAASAQPARGCAATGRIMTPPGTTTKSTFVPIVRLASRMTALGTVMPAELPILRNALCIALSSL